MARERLLEALKDPARRWTQEELERGFALEGEYVKEVVAVVMPTIKEQILDDLNRLSPEQQRRAAELVHGLVSPLPKGASVEDLMKVAGTLDDQSAREMMAAIEEGCERVDLDEW